MLANQQDRKIPKNLDAIMISSTFVSLLYIKRGRPVFKDCDKSTLETM